jgi:integrase/recombinase XerD
MPGELIDERGSAAAVWIRLSAFLSLKSPLTRTTYSGIIQEWCRFLGAQSGTDEAARKIVSATDLHAIAYRRFLEGQPGEAPRMIKKASKNNTARDVEIRSRRLNGRGKKKTGLEFSLSNATIHKKFAALRRMYRMLIASDLGVRQNPFEVDRVPAPPKEAGRKRPTEMVNFELVSEIINLPDVNTAKGLRDRAILTLLFGGGLRRSEVLSLRIGDVRRTAEGTPFVYLRHTKAKRDASQGIPDWTAEALEKLIAHRRQNAGACDHDHLFVGFTGQGGKKETNTPLSETSLYLLFKGYCSRAGVEDYVTPHSARATAITKLLSDGLSHREVQEFSRHASVQMVEWYDKRRFDVEQSPARKLSFAAPRSKRTVKDSE